MKIKQKIGLGFGIPVFIILVVAVIFTLVTKKTLQKEIAESALRLSNKTIRDIDKGIYYRLEQIQAYTGDILMANALIASNNEFDKIDNVQNYINAIDMDWINGKETLFINNILNNELSKELSEIVKLYNEKYKYPVFSEIFVTNRYGGVVGSTGRTTDYRQDDEEWHQKTLEETNFWVGGIQFDESSSTISMCIVVKIYDDLNNFIGAIKAVLNIEDVKNTINLLQADSQYKSMSPHLVNKNGYTIFSGIDPKHKKLKINIRLEEFGEDISSRKSVAQAIKGIDGYSIVKENGKDLLSCFVHSKGFKDFKGIGWSLIVDYDAQELFESVTILRNIIIVISSISFLIFIFLSVFVNRHILAPLKKLTDIIVEFGQGKIDATIEIGTKDEIGQLSVSFNKMAKDLQNSRNELISAKEYAENIVLSMLDALVIVTPEAIIQKVNLATLSLLGYKESELIGKPINMIFEQNRLFKTEGIDDLIQKGFISGTERTYLTKDGKKIPVIFSGAALRNKQGEIEGLVCIAKDISEIKRAENAIKETAEAQRKKALELEHLNIELRNAYGKLETKTEHLERFHNLTIGREFDMIKLKEEVNALLQRIGQPKKYKIMDEIKKLKKDQP